MRDVGGAEIREVRVAPRAERVQQRLWVRLVLWIILPRRRLRHVDGVTVAPVHLLDEDETKGDGEIGALEERGRRANRRRGVRAHRRALGGVDGGSFVVFLVRRASTFVVDDDHLYQRDGCTLRLGARGVVPGGVFRASAARDAVVRPVHAVVRGARRALRRVAARVVAGGSRVSSGTRHARVRPVHVLILRAGRQERSPSSTRHDVDAAARGDPGVRDGPRREERATGRYRRRGRGGHLRQLHHREYRRREDGAWFGVERGDGRRSVSALIFTQARRGRRKRERGRGLRRGRGIAHLCWRARCGVPAGAPCWVGRRRARSGSAVPGRTAEVTDRCPKATSRRTVQNPAQCGTRPGPPPVPYHVGRRLRSPRGSRLVHEDSRLPRYARARRGDAGSARPSANLPSGLRRAGPPENFELFLRLISGVDTVVQRETPTGNREKSTSRRTSNRPIEL